MRKSEIPEVNAQLQQYVAENVLPRYDSYDKAHSRRHIQSVIDQSMEIFRKLSAGQMDGGRRYELNPDMVYAIAAYHDIGVCEGREYHHLSSGRMLEEDVRLRQWFTEEQMHVMREAVEDHRSSSKSWPRSIYGRIVSEADKVIDFDTVFSRAILYARAHYSGMTDEGIFRKSYGHLQDKYGDGGYMRLQFSDSPNAGRLAELREKLRDPELMRREYSLFEVHPLEPFMPENARVLLLGSFPPPHERWSMEFFYPNFQNDMWRIMGLLFYGDKEHFVVPGQRRFDNFLKIIEPTDIRSLLSRMPLCRTVVSTGGKSAEQIASILNVPVPPVGGSVHFTLPAVCRAETKSGHASEARTVIFYRMPSSSRAYPLPLEKKAAAYSTVLISPTVPASEQR